MESLFHSLYGNIKSNLSEWYKSNKSKTNSDLFIILIADNRSVLFILQKETVSETNFNKIFLIILLSGNFN